MGGLIGLECLHCQGEGELLWTGRPGEYSPVDASFLPSEGFAPCPECDGEGKIEVCATCLQPCVIRSGREYCTCAVLSLPQAA